MEKYNVDAYISGHDHNLQHYYENGVHYYVSGLGEVANPNLVHLNDYRNPPFLFFSIMKNEHLGIRLLINDESSPHLLMTHSLKVWHFLKWTKQNW